MINLLGKRYLFFALSLLIIIPGMILTALGLPLSIDFTGGTYVEARFEGGNAPAPAEVITFFQEDLNVEEVRVQSKEGGRIVIRSSALDEDTHANLQNLLESRFNDQVEILRFETVQATIGKMVVRNAGLAVAVAALAVIVYIAFAFRGVPHAFRYGVCAIIAMIHDIAIVISLVAIGGRLFGWQVDSLFMTALLTVMGFSVQDKIVVFDRIRENTTQYKRLDFEVLVNHSIVQTLQRSINTQLMTVEFMLLALALFGGVTLREFAVILLVGLLSGTYSSIFIAAPILVVWEKQEWKRWFNRTAVSNP